MKSNQKYLKEPETTQIKSLSINSIFFKHKSGDMLNLYTRIMSDLYKNRVCCKLFSPYFESLKAHTVVSSFQTTFCALPKVKKVMHPTL